MVRPAISREFVEGLGLGWNPLTTQIESHDWQAELYSDVARFGRILHNLATDVWTYISLGFFAQDGQDRIVHALPDRRNRRMGIRFGFCPGIVGRLSATFIGHGFGRGRHGRLRRRP